MKTKTTPKPDAWMQLVLATMSKSELQHELKTATGDERRWMLDALAKKEQSK